MKKWRAMLEYMRDEIVRLIDYSEGESEVEDVRAALIEAYKECNNVAEANLESTIEAVKHKAQQPVQDPKVFLQEISDLAYEAVETYEALEHDKKEF
jgi:hypothetical protein